MKGLDRDLLSLQLSDHFNEIELEALANDVEPFLFDPSQKDRVITLPQYLKQALII
jgi:hypothetical protein